MKRFPFQFLDLSVRSVQDKLLLLFSVVAFAVILFLSTSLDIYYDEAYTYLNAGRLRNIWTVIQFRIANVHPLNSILIAVSTAFFPYSDLAIRFPAILSGAVYIAIAFGFSKQFRFRFAVFGLLVFFDYLLLFLGLARGYGLCAMLVLLLLVIYNNREKDPNWIRYFLWTAIAAFYANYVIVPFLAVFGVYIFCVDMKFKLPELPKRTWIWTVGLALLGVYGFILVTLTGKPLYGAYEARFIEAIPNSLLLHFIEGIDISPQYTMIGSVVLLVAVVGVYLRTKKNEVGLIMVISFGLIYMLSALLDKPLPTGRTLLPYWPIIVLSVLELFNLGWIEKQNRGVLSTIGGVLVLLIISYNALSQIAFRELWEGRTDQWLLAVEYTFDEAFQSDPNYKYYAEKTDYHALIPRNLQGRAGELTFESDQLEMMHYADINLISFKTKNPGLSMNIQTYCDGKLEESIKVPFENGIEYDDDFYMVFSSSSQTSDSVHFSNPEVNLSVGFNQGLPKELRPLNEISFFTRPHLELGTNAPIQK